MYEPRTKTTTCDESTVLRSERNAFTNRELHSRRPTTARCIRFLFLVLLGLSAIFFGFSAGQGEAKGKPPPAPVDGGVIYYYSYRQNSQPSGLYAMAPDGTQKRLILEEVLHGVEPSELVHADERWFLTFTHKAGEAYPDGRPRYELAARSESGQLVQLSDDPSLQLFYSGFDLADSELGYAAPRWSLGDSRVSFVARRWGVDAGGDPVVTDGGIYSIDLDVDIAAGPGIATPTEVLVGFSLVQMGSDGLYPDIAGYDWSPDGSRIVYAELTTTDIYVADLVTGSVDRIVADGAGWGGWPRWSVQDEIAFFADPGLIFKVNPDGSGLSTLAEPSRRGSPTLTWFPIWSPTGINFAFELYRYGKYPNKPDTRHILRMAADGTDEAELTGDLRDPWVYLAGWRAE